MQRNKLMFNKKLRLSIKYNYNAFSTIISIIVKREINHLNVSTTFRHYNLFQLISIRRVLTSTRLRGKRTFNLLTVKGLRIVMSCVLSM